MSVPVHKRLVLAHARMAGWGYSSSTPAVPEHLPGVPRLIPVAVGLGSTDCTTYGGWVVLAIRYDLRPANVLDETLWKAISIQDRGRPWSGIEALVERGCPEQLPNLAGVYALQRWTGLDPETGVVVEGVSEGHFCLFVVTAGGAYVYEARASKHKDGSGPGVVCRRVPTTAWKSWGQVRSVRLD